MRTEIQNIIDDHGGIEAFLDWCETTQTDALSTFDITDDEWAELTKPGMARCKHCGHVIVFRLGCWQDDDGYACPAITVGRDEHEPTTVRYIARFTPQAWINDNAVEIDAHGDPEWDCTRALATLPQFRDEVDHALNDGIESRAARLVHGDHEVLDNDDLLKNDPDAPEWVRQHHGPFDIHIRMSA